MAHHFAAPQAPEIPIVPPAAEVVLPPEAQVGDQGALFEVPRSADHDLGAGRAPLASFALFLIGVPESQTIRPVDPEHEPTIEDDQVGPAGGPIERIA